jgi:hypothetical protein
MKEEGKRPYFSYSISQLEAVYEQSGSDVPILRLLDHELNQRKTDRAGRLRAVVATAIAAVDLENAPADIDVGKTVKQGASRVDFRDDVSNESAAAHQQPSGMAMPATIDIGELPSIPMPGGANEPRAILAAWTALEALSPQTYRRPEDLVAGDRRRVADLSTGRVPWASGERSLPKHQLYYQIILGAIFMDRATEDLVRAFGEDEERSSRIREKAAIAAVLVDRNGRLVEENGVAVSSFAWALPLALKLKLDSLGGWPKIEATIIGKLDGILRRIDEDGTPIPVDLPTIEKTHHWLLTHSNCRSSWSSHQPSRCAFIIISNRRIHPR